VNHLDDDAELYALGLTEPERRPEIEAHLAECTACAQRVAAAESAAAALSATLPPMPAAARSPIPAAEPGAVRRSWWTPLATAAAVAFAFTSVVEGGIARGASERVARTDVALTALASTHFGHTTLTSQPGIIAKAIYSRDGSWCYVVATGAPRGAHVILRRATPAAGSLRDTSAIEDAGALDDGTPATLFAQHLGRATEVQLVAGGTVVAHGKPVY
jgi:hypothetical protein